MSLPPSAAAGEPNRYRARARTAVGVAVVVLVVAAAAYAALSERHDLSTALHRLGFGLLVAAFGCGVVSILATFMAWRQVLSGLGVEIPLFAAARVFYVSQLGKYLPGSVWPALMQMEAGRAHGASRRTMLGANIFSIVLGTATGLLVASILLPLHGSGTLEHYWWVFLALPVLLALLYPKVLPAVMDLGFRILRRPSVGETLDPRAEGRASVWFLVNWAALGLQIFILAWGSAPIHISGPSTYALATGGMGLATAAGVLVLPAPAGAGIREVVLGLVLASVMSTGTAVVLVLTSRVLLTMSDLTIAGVASLIGDRGSTSVE